MQDCITGYYFPSDVIDLAGETSFDWVNLSFEWRPQSPLDGQSGNF